MLSRWRSEIPHVGEYIPANENIMANQDKKTITYDCSGTEIAGKWIEGCRYWTDNTGKSICTYWDIEGDGFRNATVSWTMKGDK